MKLSDIRAAIKAKNDSLNIVPPTPVESVPIKPQVIKSSTKKSNSAQNTTYEEPATPPQPAKKQSSKREFLMRTLKLLLVNISSHSKTTPLFLTLKSQLC